MGGSHQLPDRSPSFWRRAASVALIALQMLLVLSPLVERPPTERATAHTHDQQTRHDIAHDESNCGLCAVRAQFADVPATPDVVASLSLLPSVKATDRGAAPTRGARTANPSRAPPTLS